MDHHAAYLSNVWPAVPAPRPPTSLAGSISLSLRSIISIFVQTSRYLFNQTCQMPRIFRDVIFSNVIAALRIPLCSVFFIDQYLSDLISLLILFFLFLLERPFQKPIRLRSFKSDQDKIWYDCSWNKVPTFDMTPYVQDGNPPWRHHTQKSAAVWWVQTLHDWLIDCFMWHDQ